ncbi:MAG: FHA domain-containing protein [Spirochaetia bacterium]|jgi:pSer/pThr/pTyr-binding forkhead associated (FHA) protein
MMFDVDGDSQNTRINRDAPRFKYSAELGKRGLLVILSRNGFGRTYVIDKHLSVLGRQADSELVIDDPLLSRRHCAVTVEEDGECFIEDLNSTNATFLNSRKLTAKSRLQYGDRIVIGNTVLRFYLEEEIEKK